MELSEIKRVLNRDHQLYDGKIDNVYNSPIKAAIESFLTAQEVKDWKKWPEARRVIAAKQLVCKLAGIDPGPIDGLFGHLTDHAIVIYDARKATGRIGIPEETAPAMAEDKPALIPPPAAAVKWPRQTPDRGEIIRFFGKPGTNQIRWTVPYPLFFGPQRLTKIGCHKLVKEPTERVLTNVLNHYGIAEIKRLRLDNFSGCLNVRYIAGTKRWSMHAWGVAFDFDAAHNGMNMHCPQAAFCAPEYDFWNEAWEAEGAISLGRARDFDHMHYQYVSL
jgi:peptidoglycan hydrolase-like protein with peptidoglycan-binding domain